MVVTSTSNMLQGNSSKAHRELQLQRDELRHELVPANAIETQHVKLLNSQAQAAFWHDLAVAHVLPMRFVVI
jgi:hypothetical protein